MTRLILAAVILAAAGAYVVALGRIPAMRDRLLRYWTGGLAVTLAAIVLAGVIR